MGCDWLGHLLPARVKTTPGRMVETPGQAQRDPLMDGIRGLALVLMMFGHAAVNFVAPPWPLWGEMLCALAPIFFFLIAGMMVTGSVIHRQRGGTHFLKRMVFLMALGVAIDLLAWQIRPFTSCEVLYAIGVYLPLTYLALKYLKHGPLALAVLVVAATPALQTCLGYSAYPLEWDLSGGLVHPVLHTASVWRHWLVDGWFPVFPWLGMMLLGSWIEHQRIQQDAGNPGAGFGLVGTAFIGLGLKLWWPIQPGLVVRLQVGGAFMPPPLGYLLWGTGTFLALLYLSWPVRGAVYLAPLRRFGRYPLLGYGFHLLVIQGIRYRFGKFFLNRWQFLLLFSLWLAVLYVVLGLVNRWQGEVRAADGTMVQEKVDLEPETFRRLHWPAPEEVL